MAQDHARHRQQGDHEDGRGGADDRAGSEEGLELGEDVAAVVGLVAQLEDAGGEGECKMGWDGMRWNAMGCD